MWLGAFPGCSKMIGGLSCEGEATSCVKGRPGWRKGGERSKASCVAVCIYSPQKPSCVGNLLLLVIFVAFAYKNILSDQVMPGLWSLVFAWICEPENLCPDALLSTFFPNIL